MGITSGLVAGMVGRTVDEVLHGLLEVLGPDVDQRALSLGGDRTQGDQVAGGGIEIDDDVAAGVVQHGGGGVVGQQVTVGASSRASNCSGSAARWSQNQASSSLRSTGNT
ncbi:MULTISPECIES: hypothetical protein [unclassified Streptomyces]|uniref:hypothetical protein n=1 Tax=unclassified Streptomyces TaxID=2593676 RepID=UPI002E7FE0A6|nr:hypothetical protein [Streptomyces sp. NBC_00589]WTI33607.1 hypothetical protein OIC96_00520 [Streptomyces sp. NBC_00775]WUB32721.1 hypothetical protein OHA51_49215 [Streptomyces sp. NBC_00589]